ncbi:hypothetical protein TrVE_jg2644 [Triparma verrucosa]|uniref:Uncharacterized protein n=1 Tax=Triparma verrucosa TaxID=1606542 RepID=A0A9W7ENY9_9STRA|nr:hypothetical protein TrVE_jg2644 [Triparma verrucosa]
MSAVSTAASAISLQMSTLRLSLVSAREHESKMLEQKETAEEETKKKEEELWKAKGELLKEKRMRVELLEKERDFEVLERELREAIEEKEMRIAECIEIVASLKSTDTSNFQSFSSQIMKLRSVLSKVVSDDEACLDAIAKKERANEEKAKVSEELEEKIGVKEKEAKELANLIEKEEKAIATYENMIVNVNSGVKSARRRKRAAGQTLEQAQGRLRKLQRQRRKRD